MIVEDEETIYQELSDLLENNNYKAIILKDFNNALNEILFVSPDLILLDINIPHYLDMTCLSCILALFFCFYLSSVSKRYYYKPLTWFFFSSF